MAELTKAIRLRRFKLQPEAQVKLVIETKIGSNYSFAVDNLSLMGIGAQCNRSNFEFLEETLLVGEMIPAAKLIWDEQEYAVGRLVLRTFEQDSKGKLSLGFSTVDLKIPIDGSISKYLESDGLRDSSPYDYELNSDRFSLANFTSQQDRNIDIFGKCKQFAVFYREWRKSAKYVYHSVRTPSKGVRVNLTRTRKGSRNDYVIMGSNDYLGLAAHPEVVAAAKEGLEKYGFGSTGSPLTTGMTQVHEELGDYLARMFKKEKVILFNSGYAANIGSLQGLSGPDDLILADVLSHASIQDGMELARATSRFFKHNQMAHLESTLEKNRPNHAGTLTVTEGVFSMDGDVPPLKEFVEISKKYNCRTFVDEAHSFGVVGPNGLGACAKHNVTEDVDVVMGTFSKIAGSIGGFVATSKEVSDWLYMFARAHVFSVSLPPSTAAAALKALQLFVENQEICNKLQQNIKHFVNGLRELDYPISDRHESAVVPVVIGDEKKLGIMSQYLMDHGVFVVPIVFPAVSRNACRFRFTVTAGHSQSDLDYVLSIFSNACEKAKISFKEMEKNREIEKAIKNVA